ncbi:MAG: hypothetical protein ISS15_09280 [Alphaproteobacteria bacterium]|nr:hypothetical protein [Alphaproteobacteria bacterium]MBL6938806.1 hypothetical protein [Alphaproteobacteria bacterium]MBL7097837.1 hypothetical protein [Alphaproteobacteria bacterium]
MRRSAIAFLLLSLATPAFALDHLEPERSSFDTKANLWDVDYNDMVLTNFKDLSGHDVVGRMIGLPSFHHEYGVGLSIHLGEWKVIAVESKMQLWGYYGRTPAEIAETHLPPDWRDIPVDRCEKRIDSALGARIANLWEVMLSATRFQEGEAVRWGADGKPQSGREIIVGGDGETFHFSASRMAGTTWSPAPDSPPGMLVDVAEAMIAYCRNDSPRNLAAIEQKTAALEHKLDESK